MSDLGEILESLDMEWVLDNEGHSYKESYGRSGRQLNLRRCPFCHSNSYKVYINAETGVGNCFSGDCSQPTFSKWKLLEGLFEVSGRKLFEVVNNLARQQGWRPKQVAVQDMSDLNTLELPASTPIGELAEVPEYLARRGVTKELADYFGLRWCESATWEFITSWGSLGRQDYSKRVIIPIFDLDGSLVSFQGRDTTGESEQRYLFPPGFASAGAYVYNGLNVTPQTKAVVVCEGVFDVVQAKRALDEDFATRAYTPVGTFGMHMSGGNPDGNDQLGRFRKFKAQGVTEVIFLWDGELKAVKGAIEACLTLAAAGFKPRIAFLEDGADPGNSTPERIRQGVLSALRCGTKLEALRVIKEARARYKTA